MHITLSKLKARLDVARSVFEPKRPSPDELLGELFQDVQLHHIFPDSMTFADMVPAEKLRRVIRAYRLERDDPHFDLHQFVKKHFNSLINGDSYTTNKNHTIEEHIEELWHVLRRDIPKSSGSLIGLPHPYVVAGGRYISQYYWDSYFIMLGLAAGGHWDMVENMTKNSAFLIRRYGFVPNGNRTYYRSRSQPPVFALMVQLLSQHNGRGTLVTYLPYLLAEHRFWMQGHAKVSDRRQAYNRVVYMPDGNVLNRYFDPKRAPRPEGYKEDFAIALTSDRPASRVYVDLRAGAESGWDYSSRWLKDASNLATIHTTDIIPVDLNSLLVILENTIADAYETLRQPALTTRFRHMAERRANAIHAYCWDSKKQYFFDYDFVLGKHTPVVSCAGMFPLFAHIATQQQAKGVAATLRKTLLKPGGLMTTDVKSGEQWDKPNGWAHFQWIAVKGLRAYGLSDLADDIKTRWLATCEDLYKKHGKLVEKYNVEDTNSPPTNGEYPLQDGFGWTNGVYMALAHENELHLRNERL